MRHATITTELVRQLRHQAPAKVTDYRDPKLPDNYQVSGAQT